MKRDHSLFLVMETILFASLAAAVFLSLRTCSANGVIVQGEENVEALKMAQEKYPGYTFELAPATIGKGDVDYIILCRVDGEWIKVGSGVLEPEESDNADSIRGR